MSGEDALAALLDGLRQRGLRVGPDDAARVAAVLRHSGGWSRARRVRALLALLGRSPEERRVLEELAPLLFLSAPERERPAEPPTLGAGRAALGEGGAPATLGSSTTTAGPKRTEDGRAATEPETRALRRALSLGLALSLAVFAALLQRSCTRPPPTPDAGVMAPAEANDGGATPTPDFAEGTVVTPPPPAPLPCLFKEPPRPPWLRPIAWGLGGLAFVLAFMGLWRLLRARRQENNILALRDAGGPRTYRLDWPEEKPLNALDPAFLRDGAFLLSQATADVETSWLDGAGTVRATTEAAGRLVLRQGRQREHRPLVFIEDVSPSMARWPGHGDELCAALEAQGTSVVRLYMDGIPREVATRPDLADRAPLVDILRAHPEGQVVLLGSASALDGPDAWDEHRHPWLGALAGALWLHPRPPDLWDEGARRLCEHLRVVALSEEGLGRLGGALARVKVPRWRPPDAGAEALPLWREALGVDVYSWLCAGAVLEELGLLTTRLFWGLRGAGVAGGSWVRTERVWEMPGLSVEADGSVRLPAPLGAQLCRDCPKEVRNKTLALVAALAEEVADRLPKGSAAAVAARAEAARLLVRHPEQVREGRQRLRRLVAEGFGGLLPGAVEEQEAWGLPTLERIEMRRSSVLALGITVLALGVGAIAAGRWMPRPEPVLQILGDNRIGPSAPLHLSLCDQAGAGGWELLARVGAAEERLVGAAATHGRVVWTVAPESRLWVGQVRPGSVALRVAYPGAALEQTLSVMLEKALDPEPPDSSPSEPAARTGMIHLIGVPPEVPPGQVRIGNKRWTGKDMEVPAGEVVVQLATLYYEARQRVSVPSGGQVDVALQPAVYGAVRLVLPPGASAAWSPPLRRQGDLWKGAAGRYRYQAAAKGFVDRSGDVALLALMTVEVQVALESAPTVVKPIDLPKVDAGVAGGPPPTEVQPVQPPPAASRLRPAMVRIPAGSFEMELNEVSSRGQPVHRVTITRPFMLAATEVTQGQYEAVVGKNPSKFTDDSRRPVEEVTWNDAVVYCNQLSQREGLQPCYIVQGGSVGWPDGIRCTGYRLPTEAEWEYAARASQTTLYAGSNTIEDVAWYAENAGRTTHQVGTRKPNAWGLYDMSGNVWEWVWDWYGKYTSETTADPTGPTEGQTRVYRGGSWYNDAVYARVAYRTKFGPGYRVYGLGFRMARSLPSSM